MGQVLFSVLGTLHLSDLEPKLACSRIGNILHTPLFRRHALAPEFRRRREWEQVYSAECEPRRKSDVVSSAARHPRVIVDKILMEGTSMNFGSALSKMVMRRLIDVYKLPNPFSQRPEMRRFNDKIITRTKKTSARPLLVLSVRGV
jgi:hypothetical protein